MNWDKCIPHVLSVLRSDYHTSIDCSPYYAILRETIQKKLAKAHAKFENTYNTRAKSISYKVGQEEKSSNFSKGINSNFNPKYIKCRVKQKIGNTLYGIEDLQGKVIGKFHASDLKP